MGDGSLWTAACSVTPAQQPKCVSCLLLSVSAKASNKALASLLLLVCLCHCWCCWCVLQGIMGVIDGVVPTDFETDDDKKKRCADT